MNYFQRMDKIERRCDEITYGLSNLENINNIWAYYIYEDKNQVDFVNYYTTYTNYGNECCKVSFQLYLLFDENGYFNYYEDLEVGYNSCECSWDIEPYVEEQLIPVLDKVLLKSNSTAQRIIWRRALNQFKINRIMYGSMCADIV